jgi:hypothetical protein
MYINAHTHMLFTTRTHIGKRGLWLKVPLACGHLVGAARDMAFQFHHAKPDYVNNNFMCK